jgi:hypothetical protein
VASSTVWNVLLAAREAWILLETSGSPDSSCLNGEEPGSGESSVKVTAVNNQARQLRGAVDRLWSSSVLAVLVYWCVSDCTERYLQRGQGLRLLGM